MSRMKSPSEKQFLYHYEGSLLIICAKYRDKGHDGLLGADDGQVNQVSQGETSHCAVFPNKVKTLLISRLIGFLHKSETRF